jgi:hypothetical protein
MFVSDDGNEGLRGVRAEEEVKLAEAGYEKSVTVCVSRVVGILFCSNNL